VKEKNMFHAIRMPESLWRRWGLPVALGALFICSGCGGAADGPKRYDVSGTITYGGQPVLAGTIMFEPDASKGNKGPAGYAEIRDGKYDTRGEAGKGTIGGPHVVRITGLDPSKAVPDLLPDGPPLFSDYQTTADLPEADATQDFEVPAKPSG
jgi:hypothetical protein